MNVLAVAFAALLLAGRGTDLRHGDSVLLERTDGSTIIGSVDSVTEDSISVDLGNERLVTVEWAAVSQWHRFAGAPHPAVRVEVPREFPGERASGRTAFEIALGATLASYGVLGASGALPRSTRATLLIPGLAGIFLAPSAGHFYAGEPGRGSLTIGLRFASTVVFLEGLGSYATTCRVYGSGSDGCSSPPEWALPLALFGAASFAALTVYDLADSPKAPERVRRRNLAVLVAPIAGRRRLAPGLGVVMRF